MTIDRVTFGESAQLVDTTGLSKADALALARAGGAATELDTAGLSKVDALALARAAGAVVWEGRARVDKFYADDDLARATPYETVESDPNLLLTAGATALLTRLTGTGVTAFDATNAHLCVGNGTTTPVVGQTDLQGASKFRKVVDAAPIVASNTLQLVATFLVADANFDWLEAGVANAAAGATLLNRFLQSFGTKTSSLQWTLTITCTVS
jgi:hypothetical protein